MSLAAQVQGPHVQPRCVPRLTSSPTMNFSQGTAWTNSERYNTCDPLYAHFYNLNYCNASGGVCSRTSSYNDLECAADTSSTYLFDKKNNSEHYVDQGNGVNC